MIDYPRLKLPLNRLANFFIRVLFRIPLNDTTNAFKAYRRDGDRGLPAAHRARTSTSPSSCRSRPSCAATRWTVIPITWRNRRTGEAKLKIKEMGSRYLFIILYVWLEKYFSRGDYRRRAPRA